MFALSPGAPSPSSRELSGEAPTLPRHLMGHTFLRLRISLKFFSALKSQELLLGAQTSREGFKNLIPLQRFSFWNFKCLARWARHLETQVCLGWNIRNPADVGSARLGGAAGLTVQGRPSLPVTPTGGLAASPLPPLELEVTKIQLTDTRPGPEFVFAQQLD